MATLIQRRAPRVADNTFHLHATGAYALARAQGFANPEIGDDRRGLGADLWTWAAILSVVDIFKDILLAQIRPGRPRGLWLRQAP